MTKNLQGVSIKDFMPFSCRSFCGDVQSGVLVADGAMGTMLYERGAFLNRAFEELNSTDIYTLRRITGRDRGFTWGDK